MRAVLVLATIMAVLGLAACAADGTYTQQAPTSSSSRSSHQH